MDYRRISLIIFSGLSRTLRLALRFGPPCLILLSAAGFYAMAQVRSFAPSYMEVDPDGYVWKAKKIAHLQIPLAEQEDPFRFHTHVWVENPDGMVSAKFAPGYPALLGAAYRLGGDTAVFYVSPIMGGLALIGSFFLFTLWMPAFAAALAVLTLATNWTYLFYSGFLLTHAANMCFTVWGMYFLWKWYRNPSPAAGAPAGLLLGYAVTIRHTSVLLGLPAVVALICRLFKDWRGGTLRPRAFATLLLSGTVFPIFLLAYHNAVYGHVFSSGYQLSGEQWAFSAADVAGNAALLGSGMHSEMLPVLFPLALIGLIVMGPWPERLMRLLWFFPVFILYSAYYWSVPGASYFRFMIVAMPLLAGTAFGLVTRFNRRSACVAATLSLCCIALMFNIPNIRTAWRGALARGRRKELAQECAALTRQLDYDAVIFTQRPLTFHLGTRANFVMYDLSAFSLQYAQQTFQPATGTQPRRQPERTERFRTIYEEMGQAELHAAVEKLVTRHLGNGRQVVFLIPVRGQRAEEYRLGPGFDWELKDRLQFRWRSGPRGRWDEWGIYQVQLAEPDEGDNR